MKLGIFSDMHLGFGEKSPRYAEGFENARQAFEWCLEQRVDAIVIPGDIFDEPVPSVQTLEEAFAIFALARKGTSSVRVTHEGKDGVRDYSYSGIPVIVLSGNHDFKGKDYANVVDLLVEAGLALRLHASRAVIEKNAEKTVLHGLSWVPDKHALEVLKLWNPQAVPGATNLLLLHQSFTEFLPFSDEMMATLSLHDLPEGFEWAINGHLHWRDRQEFNGKKFLLAGSTVATQVKKLEAGQPKGTYLLDTNSGEMTFFPFKRQRTLFYHPLSFEGAQPQEVLSQVRSGVESDLKGSFSMPPLIRFRLRGTLAKGVAASEVDVLKVLAEFEGKALFSVSRQMDSLSFSAKLSELRSAQAEKKSVNALGFELLQQNLAETDFADAFDVKEIFDLLSEKETDKVLERLSGGNSSEN
ncbi:MAG: DNA repair exonuclease [Candidatus Diapherotrites archaeon]|nr:DNA repair exonuclease [Candidatus Diapherotrites archaeon]